MNPDTEFRFGCTFRNFDDLTEMSPIFRRTVPFVSDIGQFQFFIFGIRKFHGKLKDMCIVISDTFPPERKLNFFQSIQRDLFVIPEIANMLFCPLHFQRCTSACALRNSFIFCRSKPDPSVIAFPFWRTPFGNPGFKAAVFNQILCKRTDC